MIKPRDLHVQHTSINFTKRNVSFQHKLVIKPLYNNKNDQLMYMLGITYNDIPPINITLFSQNLNEIKDEMECLPFAYSLTSPTAPFSVIHVNAQWVSLCGYSVKEMVGNTFQNIKCNRTDYQEDTTFFKSKILTTMISILLGIIS
jgi:hypothetical protein